VPTFSKKSVDRLETCDHRIQMVLKRAITRYDFTVLCGHRNKEEQNDAFERGASKLRWPNSKHNKTPSLAVDVAPFPIDWDNLARFRELAAIIMDEADKAGIKLRWGGDFNMNGKPDDKFVDMPHFEIYERSK
jgi:peptidoglycan L-alanyl-D-glutamate endopeptidase CwlK